MMHKKHNWRAALALASLLALTACEDNSVTTNENTTSMNEQKTGIAGLPGAKGRSFDNLDQYLAHLEIQGHYDFPFYEKVGPDRYKLNTGRGGQYRPAQYFTRQQLMKKFGFER